MDVNIHAIVRHLQIQDESGKLSNHDAALIRLLYRRGHRPGFNIASVQKDVLQPTIAARVNRLAGIAPYTDTV